MCVCVERERERCVCVRVWRERERERESVCVCVERVCVCPTRGGVQLDVPLWLHRHNHHIQQFGHERGAWISLKEEPTRAAVAVKELVSIQQTIVHNLWPVCENGNIAE